jgi:carbon storage regulator
MLILTRRVGESIKIGDEVTVKPINTKDGQVKILIIAPREITVHRGEIYEKTKANPGAENKPTDTEGTGRLIFTRRAGETVMVGDEVEVAILGVKGNQTRLGITAPQEVAVHRQEIYERIRQEKKADDDALDGGTIDEDT